MNTVCKLFKPSAIASLKAFATMEVFYAGVCLQQSNRFADML